MLLLANNSQVGIELLLTVAPPHMEWVLKYLCRECQGICGVVRSQYSSEAL